MKIYAYPADAWGCGSYRVTWPAMAVSISGDHDVTITEPGCRSVAMQVTDDGRVTREAFPMDADVVVLQRPTNHFLLQVIPMLRARGVAVVVDMDDDLSCIDPRNPAHAALAPRVTQVVPHPFTRQLMPMEGPNMHSFHNAAAACRAATMVTVTTPALAERYGAHGRVRVIPNFVPARYLDIPHRDSEVVGWGGSVHSHPDDLQQVGAAIARLRNGGVRFETVGDPAGVGRALGIGDDPPSPGPVSLADWPAAIAAFGIGIAPLAPTKFNDAKSALKPLEYSSVGVPCVVSPSADYQRFADVCPSVVVAARPRAWEAALRSLVADPVRRAEMSEAGRDMARGLTIEGNAHRWSEAWQAAVDVERQKVPAGVA